jgi:hypothetical protein
MADTQTKDRQSKQQKPEQQPQPEKISLDAFIEGDEEATGKQECTFSASDLKDIVETLNEIEENAISRYKQGLNDGKPSTKRDAPRWLEPFLAAILALAILFVFLAAAKPWPFIPEGIQGKAWSVILQVPLLLISFFAGRSSKKE